MDRDGFDPNVLFNVDTGDKFSQWTGQETHDFLVIRGELDPVFMETRRNKLLWETVSTRMREIGYHRNPQQCKSKWKNLVTPYKGCESMEVGEIRQETFPFYNDLQIIFNARIQRLMWLEAQGATTAPRQHHAAVQVSSTDDDEGCREKKKKRKETGGGETSTGKSIVSGLKEVMEEYMKRQVEMEMQWMKAYEEREERRRVREREWRQRMEVLESERERNKGKWGKKLGLTQGMPLLMLYWTSLQKTRACDLRVFLGICCCWGNFA